MPQLKVPEDLAQEIETPPPSPTPSTESVESLIDDATGAGIPVLSWQLDEITDISVVSSAYLNR